MRPVVFDTSVYIPYLRGEAYTALIERVVQAGRVRLSAVVLGELYAGTRSPQDKADLDVVTRVYQFSTSLRRRAAGQPPAPSWVLFRRGALG